MRQRVKMSAALAGALLVSSPALAFAAGDGHGSLGTTALFHAINLVALVGVIVYFARGPVSKMLAERKAQVTAELEEARRLHEEARALLSQYEGRLAGLDAEKTQILNDYRQLGEAERDRIVGEAKRQAEKIGRDAELTVQSEVRRARAALEREVVQLAAELAEERLRERLDARAQGALFDAYLVEMGRDLRS